MKILPFSEIFVSLPRASQSIWIIITDYHKENERSYDVERKTVN
jgi:hypothetical protein